MIESIKRYGRSIARKIFLIFKDSPLPDLTPYLRDLIEDLQRTVAELPERDIKGLEESEASWVRNCVDLRQDVITKDPRGFLRWPVVSRTMVVHSPAWVANELDYLKRMPDWSSRWRPVLREAGAGHPLPYWRYAASSGNRIHTTYSAARFEAQSSKPLSTFDTIFEFGGGYGSMCSLVHQLGFTGRYVIFDLPEFSALQRFYLRWMGVPVLANTDDAAQGCICTADFTELSSLLDMSTDHGSSAMIAMWSLSETPLDLRESVRKLTESFDAYFIASQSRYKEVDNTAYFPKQWMGTDHSVQWRQEAITHLGNNFYLIGLRESPRSRSIA